MSYTMQPLDRNGRYINGGNHYANADTIQRAREWANKVAGTTHCGWFVWGVQIVGELMEFRGAWHVVSGQDGRYESETVRWTGPAPLTAADERKSCYPTTVLDFYEVVHERRSDGSCKCGQHKAGPNF